ncbi:MAG: hypothetical protein Q4G49_07595 [Paracoccus sp. (in: a-proteobacteria)]|nr:hypothetical protein [Paracoccus sp. (in: a-proteobacteria)]
MAKAALGLNNPQIADMTGLHRNTLNRLDKGDGKASTIKLVRLTLEAEGVRFLDPGQVSTGYGVTLPEDAREAGGD